MSNSFCFLWNNYECEFVWLVCLFVYLPLCIFFFKSWQNSFSKCSNSVDSFFFTKLYEFYKKIDFFAFLPYLFRKVVILIQIVKNAKFPNGKEVNFHRKHSQILIFPSPSFWTKLNQNFKLVLYTNLIWLIVFKSESFKVEKKNVYYEFLIS